MIVMKKAPGRRPSRLVEPVPIAELQAAVANVVRAASDLKTYVDGLAKEKRETVNCEARGLPALAEDIAKVQASIVRNLFSRKSLAVRRG
jgi:hypothetical protein